MADEFDSSDFSQTLTDTSLDDAPPAETEEPAVEEVDPDKLDEEPFEPAEKKVEEEPEPKVEGDDKKSEKKVEAKVEDQMVKVKVLGKEREVPVRELVRSYQKAEAADKRFQEAAHHKAEAEQFFREIQEDPWKAFEIARMDPDQAAERRTWDRFVLSRMTPEQRAQWTSQQRLAELESKQQRYEEEQRHAQAYSQAQQAVEAYAPALEAAVKAHGVPNTQYAQQKLVDYLFADLNDGVEPDPVYLAERVNADLMREIASLRTLPPEKLAELLGDETAKKLAQVRARQGKVRPGNGKVVAQARAEKPLSYTTEDDFAASMQKFRERGD